MPKVSVYIRPTTGNRTPKKATSGSTGPFYLRYELNGKRIWESLSTRTYTFALADARSKESSLLREEAAPPKPSPVAPKSVEELRAAFIHDKRTSRKKNGELRDEDTIRGYEHLTREFLDFTKIERPDQITTKVLKAWIGALYERKRHKGENCVSHRTVVNLYINTVCFLHFVGVDHKTLVPEAERPATIDEEPEAYTEAEMEQFFTAIKDRRDLLFFQFLRRTGAREKEATHLEWTNLNLGARPTVTFRNQGGFKTKTRKFRTVPLDPEFAADLRAWKHEHGQEKYVFGREEGTAVEGHYLRKCKEYAEEAGLDQTNFWLHKFRDTAATTWLLRDVPLRTVQKWMGHSSILMTERYLAPEQDDVQQMRMANVWARPAISTSAAVWQ